MESKKYLYLWKNTCLGMEISGFWKTGTFEVDFPVIQGHFLQLSMFEKFEY